MNARRPDAVSLAVAALAGDLAKRALELQASSAPADPDHALDDLIRLVRAAGGRCDHDLADAEVRAVAPPLGAHFSSSPFRPVAGPSQLQRRDH